MPEPDQLTRNPIINGLVVLRGVLDVLVYLARVIWLRRPVPCTHVDADSQAIRQQLLRSLDVDISACGRRCRVEVGVVRGEFATESFKYRSVCGLNRVYHSKVLTVHPARNFTGLLVTPPDRSEISLVVHETAIEERLLVRICRLDMDLQA